MNLFCPYRLIISFAVLTLDADAVEIDLGGLRMVRATVSHEASRIVCKVSFMPVTCFDAGTNILVNAQKARGYAVQAIAKAQGYSPAVIAISNLRLVTAPEIITNRYNVGYRADSVEVVRKDSPNYAEPVNEVSGTRKDSATQTHESSLMTCFEDTLSTLYSLADAFQERISNLQVGDDLDDETASLEQLGVGAFGKLANEVDKQKLLLKVEKVELISHINRMRDAFLKSLAKAYKIHQRTTKH